MFFWPGSESPSESASSEMSLSGIVGVKREVKLIKTPNRDIDEDEGPLYFIKFLQEGGKEFMGVLWRVGQDYA